MLTIVDIHKRFGEVQALAGCSYSIERGHMLGFLGPNGAGKTTTMRAVFGLVELDGGECSGTDGRSSWQNDRASATCRRSAASTRACESVSRSSVGDEMLMVAASGTAVKLGETPPINDRPTQ